MVEKVSRRSRSGRLLLIGVLVVVCLVAVLLFSGSGDAPALARSRDETALSSGDERRGATPGAADGDWALAQRHARLAVEGEPAASVVDDGFTVAGRCVDDEGRPLAEVTAVGEFTVSVRYESDAWLQEPDAGAITPEAQTDDAGRFELRFAALGQGKIDIHLERAGLRPVWLSSFRKDVLPGARLDVGDVTLTVGQRIFGRVVDTEGRPVVGAEIDAWSASIDVQRDGWSHQIGDGDGETVTDESGWFAFPEPMPTGAYEIDLADRRVLRPLGPVIVTLGAEPRPLRVVVAVAAEGGAHGQITGRVVDAAGQPLAQARISTGPDWQVHDDCTTRADGCFELHQWRDVRDAVDLFAGLTGFVGWSAEGPVDWGTHDLRIVLATGPRLTLVVTDARDGAPVDRFGLLLQGKSNHRKSTVAEHPGGRLELEPLTPESLALRVIAPRSSGLIDPVGTRVDLQADLELRVELQPCIDQPVEVVDDRGLPAANLTVQWVELPEGYALEPLTAVQSLVALELPKVADQPRVIASARTDLRGLARLSGIAGPRNFAIRLPGPGCAPTVVMPSAPLDPEVPLRIVVARHSSLTLEFGPDDALAGLRRQALEDPDFGWTDVGFGVGLVRADPVPDVEPAGALPADLGQLPFRFPSGTSLTLTGIPAGLWQVRIGWGNRQRVRSWPVGPPLRLDGAETRRVRIGLDELRHQRLVVRTSINGQPAAAVGVYCQGRSDEAADQGDDEEEGRWGETAADGTVEFLVPPGRWVVQAWSDRADWDRVEVVVDRTSEARVELACSLATRAIRVLRPDGSPLAWSEDLLAEAEQGDPWVACTDDAGRSVLSGEPGLVTLRIPRAPFLVDGDAAWERFQEQHPEVDDAARWIEVGKIELRAGDDPNEILLRLPPEWAELPR